MPVTPTYPGVYIEEVPSGVRTIGGVSTSIGLFIGRAGLGEMNVPTRCLSYAEFRRKFGEDATQSELPRQAKLFFDNGGSQCFVVRIAHFTGGATGQSKIVLRSEIGATGAEVLVLTAKSAGTIGDQIRAAVNYNTPSPESTFNLELFRWGRDASGALVKQELEAHSNLTMNPQSTRYAPRYITQSSSLVKADAGTGASPTTPPTADGYSLSGLALPVAAGTVKAAWDAIVVAGGKRDIRIQVDGGGFETVDIGVTGADDAAIGAAVKAAIDGQLVGRTVSVDFVDGPTVGPTAHRYLRIRSNQSTGEVVVQSGPAPGRDAAAVPNAVTGTLGLMLGTGNGGIEVGRWSSHRPAPTGITLSLLVSTGPGKLTTLTTFAETLQNAITNFTINGISVSPAPNSLNTPPNAGTDPIFKHSNGGGDGVREKLGIIAARINNLALSNSAFKWRAELWGSRLAIIPTDGPDNVVPSAAAVPTATTMVLLPNVRYYSLGTGSTGRQTGAVAGSNGSEPDAADYRAAYEKVDKDVDLINLMVIPRDNGSSPTDRRQLWGEASAFCQKRRAFLLIDPPDNWVDRDTATNTTVGVSTLRTGLVKDHAAVFFPMLKIFDGGGTLDVDPAGAIAGLMARVDGARGVWKAPAGTEADVRGIAGLKLNLSNDENGVLNQRAVNTIRLMPTGVVNWGARTVDGDDDFGSEWKYIPVRRLALYLEESIYRGIQWAVFEPNDEPLWAQLRLNIGAFMHSLFRQGAFQGRTPNEAYVVKCDKDTTTQDDINRGIVNVLVGFAPLKPAEFVIVRIQQLAGQLAV